MVQHLASFIDHTLLRPDATRDQIRDLCAEAHDYGFATVCVPPFYVQEAVGQLARGRVGICTVVGFPLGYSVPTFKALEAERAVGDGATEVDMVLNVAAFKSGEHALCEEEIEAIAEISHDGRALLKVIIETALLSPEEIRLAGALAARAGADFVKTSTGFAARGASVADVQLLRATLPAHVRIKAAGGIKTRAQAEALLAAGASRLGCSASVHIVSTPAAPSAPEAAEGNGMTGY